MLKSISINFGMLFLFRYFAEQYLNKNKMKDFFLKAKQWILSHSWGTNLQILSAFLVFIGLVYVVIAPKDFTPLTAIILIAFLSNLTGRILNNQ
jgi:hypothetical protein